MMRGGATRNIVASAKVSASVRHCGNPNAQAHPVDVFSADVEELLRPCDY
jgi:hypothetical protein